MVRWKGTVVQHGEVILDKGWPGVPVRVTVDTSKWDIVEPLAEANHYGRLVLRFKRSGTERSLAVPWKPVR